MYTTLVSLLVGLVASVTGSAVTGSAGLPTVVDSAGQAPDPPPVVAPIPAPIDDTDPLDYAIADFAAHTGADPEDIEVVLNQNVTWSDSSLGCPQPDHMYIPVQVAGYLIVLHAQPEVATYHGARDQVPFRCERPE